MLDDILPNEILNAIKKISIAELTELRIREGKPIVVYMGSIAYFLGEHGLYTSIKDALIATRQQIKDIIFLASNCSIYSVNEKIKKGYIVISNGVRIGICGDVVIENGIVKTISNYSSVNIRIPHQIKNCSLSVFNHIYQNGNVNNTLIISPPGAGKTTLLRDLIYQISLRSDMPICVVDERAEIAPSGLMIGDFTDVISFAEKTIAFEHSLRSMSPKIIATDEICNIQDTQALENVFNSGVKVFATIHANNIDEIKKKSFLAKTLTNKYFTRFIVLSNRNGIGTIEGVFDEKFNRLMMGEL